MTIKIHFTDDQWFLLGAMPGLVGAAMSNAAPSGIIGTVKEMSAAMRTIAKAKQDFPDSELINELVQKAANWDEAKEKITDYRERTKERMATAEVTTREGLQNMALQDCREALALVDEHCTDDDKQAYRQWTLSVARSVAEAAKEGSILGFGGERVSAEERKLIVQLEEILGIQSGMLIA